MPMQKKPTKPTESFQVVESHQTFLSPIPPPEELHHYEAVIPGAADRILRMTEAESQHRQRQEEASIQANIASQQRQISLVEFQARALSRSDLLGQLLGFAVSIASLSGCVYLAYLGQPWVASALVGLPLAGVIRALRERHKPKRQERGE